MLIAISVVKCSILMCVSFGSESKVDEGWSTIVGSFSGIAVGRNVQKKSRGSLNITIQMKFTTYNMYRSGKDQLDSGTKLS